MFTKTPSERLAALQSVFTEAKRKADELAAECMNRESQLSKEIEGLRVVIERARAFSDKIAQIL